MPQTSGSAGMMKSTISNEPSKDDTFNSPQMMMSLMTLMHQNSLLLQGFNPPKTGLINPFLPSPLTPMADVTHPVGIPNKSVPPPPGFETQNITSNVTPFSSDTMMSSQMGNHPVINDVNYTSSSDILLPLKQSEMEEREAPIMIDPNMTVSTSGMSLSKKVKEKEVSNLENKTRTVRTTRFMMDIKKYVFVINISHMTCHMTCISIE